MLAISDNLYSQNLMHMLTTIRSYTYILGRTETSRKQQCIQLYIIILTIIYYNYSILYYS